MINLKRAMILEELWDREGKVDDLNQSRDFLIDAVEIMPFEVSTHLTWAKQSMKTGEFQMAKDGMLTLFKLPANLRISLFRIHPAMVQMAILADLMAGGDGKMVGEVLEIFWPEKAEKSDDGRYLRSMYLGEKIDPKKITTLSKPRQRAKGYLFLGLQAVNSNNPIKAREHFGKGKRDDNTTLRLYEQVENRLNNIPNHLAAEPKTKQRYQRVLEQIQSAIANAEK